MIYVFNPSTEMALAAGTASYTPPQQIIDFERRLSLLPALYAPAGSTILLLHAESVDVAKQLPYFDTAQRKGIALCTLPELMGVNDGVEPWGWNTALWHLLKRKGGDSLSLPRLSWCEMLREMAHRRTAVQVWKLLSESGVGTTYPLPICLSDSDAAITHINELGHGCVIKSPWSSSGRGVCFTDGMEVSRLRSRIEGVIRRQGAIIIEPFWNRVLDFASEWVWSDGRPIFLGLSQFTTDASGRYAGNLVASQEALRGRIETCVAGEKLNYSIASLKDALSEVLSPLNENSYRPVFFGVDMLVDEDGNINPCIEINLRRTMGHVALSLAETIKEEFLFVPSGPHLKQ